MPKKHTLYRDDPIPLRVEEPTNSTGGVVGTGDDKTVWKKKKKKSKVLRRKRLKGNYRKT